MSRPCSICREIVLDRTQEAPIAINHHHHHHLVHHHHHHFECMENKGAHELQRTKGKSRRAKARGHHFSRKENKRWAKSTTLNPECSLICCTTRSLPFLFFCPSSGLEVVRRTYKRSHILISGFFQSSTHHLLLAAGHDVTELCNSPSMNFVCNRNQDASHFLGGSRAQKYSLSFLQQYNWK